MQSDEKEEKRQTRCKAPSKSCQMLNQAQEQRIIRFGMLMGKKLALVEPKFAIESDACGLALLYDQQPSGIVRSDERSGGKSKVLSQLLFGEN